MTIRCSVLAATVFLAASTLAARADVISYSSAGAFNAASTTTAYGFPAAPGTSMLLSSPYTSGPLTFAALNGSLYLQNDGAYATSYLDDFTGSDLQPAQEQITLAGATALAFDIGVYNGSGLLTFAINGQSFVVTTPTAQVPVFVGFTSSTPITNFTISEANYSEIDILDYKAGSSTSTGVSPVPEPSSLALLGTGALALVGAARRRFSRS